MKDLYEVKFIHATNYYLSRILKGGLFSVLRFAWDQKAPFCVSGDDIPNCSSADKFILENDCNHKVWNEAIKFYEEKNNCRLARTFIESQEIIKSLTFEKIKKESSVNKKTEKKKEFA